MLKLLSQVRTIRQEIFDARIDNQSQAKLHKKAKINRWRSTLWWEEQHNAWWIGLMAVAYLITTLFGWTFVIYLFVASSSWKEAAINFCILLVIAGLNMICIKIAILTNHW